MSFSKEDVLDQVLSVVSEKLRIPKENLKPAATFKDLGVDSLDFVEIVMGLEDVFSIKIKDERAEQVKNIQDVVDLIYELRSK